jgi:A118 family predicted phage portal protein
MSSEAFDRPDRMTRMRNSGGIIGSVSRWLWGSPPSATASDNRLHVPVAADLATGVASLIYSEPPRITARAIGEGDDAEPDPTQQAVVDRIVEAGLIPTLRMAAEPNAVLGDVYLRPVIDREVSPDGALTSVVHADQAVPVFRWGRLVEVTFWSEIGRTNSVVYRLLEHHDVVDGAGRITYHVYEGKDGDLGKRISLSAFPMLAGLAGVVDEDGSQLTGLDRLDVVHYPNAGPQRRWRSNPMLKYCGRSDYDGNEQVFDQIDVAWTSWLRDIRLGAGRITVPGYMLEGQGPGKGAVWDVDREVYSAINAIPNDGTGLTVTQFAIRHAEHKATIDALFEVALRHSGLSAQTLGEQGGDVAMTATEAQARERLSFVTRGDRTATGADVIARYLTVHTMLEMVHGIGKVAEPLEGVNVEFGDSVSEAPETVARTLQLLVAADAISHEMRVRALHPEWDADQVAQEVARIKDAAAPVENVETFTGGEPDDSADPFA